MQLGMPGEKSMSFGPSAKRLLGWLAPDRARVLLILALTIVAVGLASVGPKVLGKATDSIFAGLLGGQFAGRVPAGTTRQEVIDQLRSQGQGNIADLLSGVDFVPGQGIDFSAVGRVLLAVLLIYVASALFMWASGWVLTGVVQRTMFRMREAVEAKLNRLPLSYFDGQPRGELLSRVTNDIDNVSMSLQQTLSQLLNSLLTVLAVLGMM